MFSRVNNLIILEKQVAVMPLAGNEPAALKNQVLSLYYDTGK